MPTKEPKDIMVSQMVHGTIQSTIMGMYVGAVTSAPVIPADVDATGAVVLYLGTTDDTFENGRFYRFGDGAWSEAPVGATFDLTPGKVVVSDAEGNLVTSDLDSTALGNLTGLTGNVQTQIDSVVSDVSSQGTRLTTAEGEIDTLQGTVSSQGTAITTAEGDIDTLQSQMGTANGNISSLQSAVAGKQDAITGGATTILTQNLGASKALISDASGKVAISTVSATELGYVAGVTSAIQTQLDNLASLISAMGGFAIESVEELPGTGQPNTIYFVPSESGAGQNIKDEYMWLNNAWELIGSTQFSLDIVQNASGITINGTALQTATTARAGLMTPTEVLAIDTLNTNLGLAEDNIETLQAQMAQKVDVTDVVTTSENGLMIASDKVKLDGIAEGANKYVLPVAGTAIGGVKNGGNVVIDGSGNATVDLSGYATTSALNAKADQTTVTELSNNLSTLDSRVDGIGITKQEIENGVKLTVNGASVDINFPEPGLICRITVNDTTGQGLNIGCTVRATGPATLTAITDSSGIATFNIETPGTYAFQTIGLSTGYQSTSEQIGVNAITGSLSITTDYPAYSLGSGTYSISMADGTYTLALTGISVDAQWAQAPFNGKLRLSGGSTQAEYAITGAIATGTTTNITVPEAMNLESLTLALICDVPTSGTQVAQNVINGIPYVSRIILGYTINEGVSDPDDSVTYIEDNAGWTPMSMSNGTLNAGSWATESAGQALLDSIKPVVRHSDGTYEDLDKRNPSNLASGGSANLTVGNDFLVYFANTFQWLSITKSGNIVTVKYATEQVDDTYHNYAFLGNDGQAKEGFSIGAVFAQSAMTPDVGTALWSSPESANPEQITLTNAIGYAENRGATADIATWDMKNYISGLFPLLFKTLNGQAHMWGNNSGSGSFSQNTVLTFTNDYGMNGVTATRTSKMAFLWIHDCWGNSWWWVGGAKTNSSRHLMVQHGARSSTDESDFEDTGIGPSSSLNGGINKVYASDTEVGFFPQDDAGSYTTPTYYSGYGFVYSSAFPLVGGGYSYSAGLAGPFYVYFGSSASNTYAVRLSFKEGEA